MDNRLYDLPNKISEKDAALFDSVYERLDKNASASNEEKKRILSSAMRKAGFEMQDNYADITINRFRRKTTVKRIFVIAAAAAALVGAVAATGTLHKVQQFFHIILPSIKTIVTLNIILSITGSLSAFEPPFVITKGANGTGTYFIIMDQVAHTSQKVGLASAMAVFLLLIIFIVTIVQKLVLKYAFRNADTGNGKGDIL